MSLPMPSTPDAITREIFPLWLRLWHAAQALCVLGLLLTGLSLHYADEDWVFLSFEWSVRAHDVLGIACAAAWAVFVVMNVVSRNVRHYLPDRPHRPRGAWRQLRYYAWGMFRGEHAPFPPSVDDKFNPPQRFAYLFVMYALLPVSVASGLLLLVPTLVPPRVLGAPGLWPVAIVHLAAGWFVAQFLVVHVYLATTGVKVSAYFKEIVTGVRTSTRPPPPADPDDDPRVR